MALATRALGATTGLAGLVAFTCHFAVPVAAGDGRSITLAEATATHRNVGVAVHLLVLAALGLTAAARPAVGARVVGVGVLGLPWLAGSVDQVWTSGGPGAVRVFAAAVLVGLVAAAVAVAVGVREVRWSDGGVLLGDGLAILVAGATLFGLLGVNWYRVRDLTRDALFEPRFGSLLDTSTGGGRAVWAAAAVAVVAIAVAVVGGGWGRRVAGVAVAGLCTFEAARRTFLTGERLIPPADQANPFGVTLSGEPVLGILVLPLVGIAAGAWLLTTDGDTTSEADEAQIGDVPAEPDPAAPA
ncbi:hypothetical protein HC251_20215 [Iamia sp. SCSIO 61187]|uniref:hypothetical protein n=1 Tax=Iamia sp. SCSIO 61187 TaxID=2722752 RepID=UPI001C639F21|nr:hypothetical protein [Iamia sp. SCSIO 61187]QYG94523.1 hypothetical protein HC251_20215 [Iamia sp. SCSIO 61187]